MGSSKTIPSYIKIKEEIENMIKNKVLKIGDKLPSEYEMANHFKVSRETFRSAVKLLEQEGKLLVKHGIGTFVIKPLTSIPDSLEKLQSMTNMIKIAGLKEGELEEVLYVGNSDAECAAALDIQKGAEIVILKRVRTADGEPVALTINMIPRNHCAGRALEEIEYLSGSLFYFLEHQCNIYITRAATEIIIPNKEDPHLLKLNISKENPVLLLKQVHYDEQNMPLLYSLDYMRNDIFRFWVQRVRNG